MFARHAGRDRCQNSADAISKSSGGVALALAAAILLPCPGFAAEPPDVASSKASTIARPYNWSGFYVGANVGYGWGDTGSIFQSDPGVWANYKPVVNGLRDADIRGTLRGVQLGYNYQANGFLLGIEVDYSLSGLAGGTNRSTASLGGKPFTVGEQAEVDWFATVRGRLGWIPTDGWLIYATGGLTRSEVQTSTNLGFTGCPCYLGAAPSTKTGWTIGGGLEMVLAGNWRLKTEYLYFDLGKSHVIGNPTAAVFVPGVQTQTEFDITGSIVRVGLNYSFGEYFNTARQ